MLKTDKSFILAAWVVFWTANALLTVSLVVILSNEYSKMHQVNAEYQKNTEKERNSATAKIEKLCQNTQGQGFVKCIGEQLSSYYKEQAAKDDLQEQKNMAFWAKWMFISSCATVLFTLFGIILLYQNLVAAREMVREAEKTTKAANDTIKITEKASYDQLRAYVVALERQHFFFQDNGILSGIKFRLRLKNTGITPAMINDAFINRRIVDHGSPMPYGGENSRGDKPVRVPLGGGLTDSFGITGFSREEIIEIAEQRKDGYLFYVVRYNDVLGGQEHETIAYAQFQIRKHPVEIEKNVPNGWANDDFLNNPPFGVVTINGLGRFT